MKNLKPSVETTTKTISRIIILALILHCPFYPPLEGAGGGLNAQLSAQAPIHKILIDTDPGIDDAAAFNAWYMTEIAKIK